MLLKLKHKCGCCSSLLAAIEPLGRNDMVPFSRQTTIIHRMQLKILFDLRLRCKAIQNTSNVLCLRDNVEIVVRIHSGKTAVVDESLAESGKELS